MGDGRGEGRWEGGGGKEKEEGKGLYLNCKDNYPNFTSL